MSEKEEKVKIPYGIEKIHRLSCSECPGVIFSVYGVTDDTLLIVCTGCGAIYKEIKPQKPKEVPGGPQNP